MEDIRPSANINKSQSLQMEKKDISEELARLRTEFRKRIELDQRETKKKLNALKKLQAEEQKNSEELKRRIELKRKMHEEERIMSEEKHKMEGFHGEMMIDGFGNEEEKRLKDEMLKKRDILSNTLELERRRKMEQEMKFTEDEYNNKMAHMKKEDDERMTRITKGRTNLVEIFGTPMNLGYEGLSETKGKMDRLKQKTDEQDARIKYLQDLLASQAERDKVQEVFCSRFQEEFIALKILQIKSFDCVLEAENRFDGYKYAVRRIQVEKSYSTVLREARALAMFDHPGIVRVYATWIESPPDGWQQRADMKLFESIYNGEITCDIMHSKSESSFIYIQMQCWNDSLASRLARNPLRDLSQTKSWFNQIVSAVEYIHEKGYIHRDLKPSNIVFTGNGLLKICNLGIVATQHDRCGTIIFMSPEQCSFFPKYSSKTDVFSLGLILTEMILVMTDDERVEVFDNYRHGRPNDQIEDRETAEFVAWLTQIDPISRPTCKEILRHSFLSDFRAE